VVLGQSALTVWVIALTLRTHGLGGRPELLAGIVAGLSVFSTLPCSPAFCSPIFSQASAHLASICCC
jgi:hypothetical protein